MENFTAEESSSATFKVLARLGSWFLFPLAYDVESCGYREFDYQKDLKLLPEERRHESEYESESGSDHDSTSNSLDDEESSIALSDYDSCRPVSTPSALTAEDKRLNLSISEIAEAYHAHQEIDQSEYSTCEGHRLDYVITQMDIARMARNASRHLDVNSILTLPTITYRSPSSQAKSQVCLPVADSRDPDEAWSFIMVPQDKSGVQDSATPAPQEHGCVICLEKFVDGDRLRVLPCDHSFHVGCIDRWLSGSHSHIECFTSGCPTCKAHPSGLDPQSISNDGSVPSWAFAQLGGALARSSDSFSE